MGVPVLTVHGDLTTRTYTRLRETAYGQLVQAPRLVVLDLAQLTALDTDGVALLVEIAYEAGEADIGLCLVIDQTRPDLVTTPLAEANVLTLFEIQPTVAGAIKTLS